MSKRVDDLVATLKEIHLDVKEIKPQVIRNTVSLEHHIKRTDLAEQRITKLEYWLLGLLAALLVALAKNLSS